MKTTTRSESLFSEARGLFPGGVNSPARAFRSVGGTPLFFQSGHGPYLIDADGNEYIDFVLSWGPLLRGHAHPEVVEALRTQASRGTSFGAPSEREIELARIIMRLMPGIESLRFVNSGTEATMSAIRVARAYTKRDKILKFQGNYHGHGDFFLVQAGSGVATLGLPDSPGVPAPVTADTLVVPYNDVGAVREVIQRYGNELAAVILEPVCGNMGVVPAEEGFLRAVRDLTRENGTVLIFDEVMTGFRVASGGAREVFGIEPDLVTLGKVIGGGLPVGAYGGAREIMELVAPEGPVYQAGTLSGNPLAMAAGIATLGTLLDTRTWDALESGIRDLVDGLRLAAHETGIPVRIQRVGTMWTVFFTDQPVKDWEGARRADTDRFAAWFHGMLQEGIYMPPSQFEAAFYSSVHSEVETEKTLAAARNVFRRL